MSLYLMIKKVSNVEFACQTNTETKSFTAGFNTLLKHTITYIKCWFQLYLQEEKWCPNLHSYKHLMLSKIFVFINTHCTPSLFLKALTPHCWTVDCNSSPYYYIFSTAHALSNVRYFPQHMLFPSVNVRCFPQHMLFSTVNVRCFPQHMLFPTVNVRCFPQHMLFPTVNVRCFPQHMLFSTVNVRCFPQQILFSTVNVRCFPQHMLFPTVNVHCRFSYAL